MYEVGFSFSCTAPTHVVLAELFSSSPLSLVSSSTDRDKQVSEHSPKIGVFHEEEAQCRPRPGRTNWLAERSGRSRGWMK